MNLCSSGASYLHAVSLKLWTED